MTIDKDLHGVLSRRHALRAGVGVIVSAIVAACTKKSPSASTPTPTAGTPTASTPSATPTAVSCIVTPEETEGPFFVDEKLNRSDIRTDPSTGSSSAGVPLALAVSVYSVSGSTCTPIEGAVVDIWHCDAGGLYSDVAQNNTSGRKFLRGYQTSDAAGAVRFTTVYPGWYQGRAVHIHFKVRSPSGSARTYEFTSQWFFDEAVTDVVHADAPYNTRGTRTTKNSNDSIYSNNGERLVLPVAKQGDGYTGSFAIGLNLA